MLNDENNFWKQSHGTAKQQSILFRNAYVIASPKNQLPHANLVVSDGGIIWLQPTDMPLPNRTWDVEVDASGYILTPGLINAHTHAALSYLRGLSHNHARMIEDLFFKTEKNLTVELTESLAFSYLLDGLRSGVTLFGDHYYFITGIGKALERLGLRGVIGETVADLGGAFPGVTSWHKAKQDIEQWSFSTRIRPLIAPHAADTVSMDLLKEMAEFSAAHGLPLHMHLAQTRGERDRVLKRSSMSPVSYASKAGALTPHTLAVHLVSTDERDLKILRDKGVTVGFCPASQIIYEKLAPIGEFMRLRLPLALATDCAPSNDGADLWSEMKLCGLLARHHAADAEYFSAPSLFEMVTEIPARVLSVSNTVGSLEVGKAADVVFIKRDLLTDPTDDVLHGLIFGTGSRNVEHVMVDGRWVLWQRQPCLVNEADLFGEFSHAKAEIFARIKRG